MRPLLAALLLFTTSSAARALLGAAPDLKKARAAAVRMTSLASEADKKFAAGR